MTIGISPPSGTAVLPDFKFTPEKDIFSLEKSITHAARKAGYKPLGNGQLVRRGWQSRVRHGIEGRGADERYYRAHYDGSQRISGALMAEKYRASFTSADGKTDLAASAHVKSRFYRQDNMRFNPQLKNTEFGLTGRDKWSMKLSRWALVGNGITEFGAAPTGVLLKTSKLLFAPGRDERSMGSQLRVLATLPVIAGVVGLFSKGVFFEGVGSAVRGVSTAIQADIRALVGSFSAIAAVGAIISLTLDAGSCALKKKSDISPPLMNFIEGNREKHLHRLYLLLDNAKNNPDARRILTLALKGKIPENYRRNEQPELLNRLLMDVRNAGGENDAKQRIERTIGSYLTEVSMSGMTPGKFLDPVKQKSELLNRENHLVALTNLIEHSDVHEHPDSENFMDLRHRVESGAAWLRKNAVGGSASLLNVLGFKNASEKTRHFASKEYIGQRELDKQSPINASKMRYSGDNILTNSHQYGPVTRNLARMSEGLRVFNYGVLLSLNYQISRPVAWLAGKITENVFHNPNSRSTSFTIGRVVASSVWAVVDAFLLISLAGGNGVGLGGPETGSAAAFPLQIPLGAISLPISIVTVAAQMLVVALPAAVFMGLAKGACYVEGWSGNVARPIEGRDSKRQPLAWGV